MEQNNHEQHLKTLKNLLSQVDRLNMSQESRGLLTEALRYVLDKLKGDEGESEKPETTSGNVNLSHDTANDVLMRVIEGKPSRSEEERKSAVLQLAALVENESQPEEASSAVNQLARLVRQHD